MGCHILFLGVKAVMMILGRGLKMAAGKMALGLSRTTKLRMSIGLIKTDCLFIRNFIYN
jgi:hypothetical protein